MAGFLVDKTQRKYYDFLRNGTFSIIPIEMKHPISCYADVIVTELPIVTHINILYQWGRM